MVAAVLTLVAALALQQAEPRLAPTSVGRFAIFADVTTIRPDGDGVVLRALQVADADFMVGETAYWGGWSWWRFDCVAQTADRIDFASLRADGVEGPAMPDRAPPREIAPGSDAEGLAHIACDAAPTGTLSLDEALRQGREALAPTP